MPLTLLISDGKSTVDVASVWQYGTELKRVSRVMAVAVGELLDYMTLRSLVSSPASSNLFTVEKIAQLNTLLTPLLDATYNGKQSLEITASQMG